MFSTPSTPLCKNFFLPCAFAFLNYANIFFRYFKVFIKDFNEYNICKLLTFLMSQAYRSMKFILLN